MSWSNAPAIETVGELVAFLKDCDPAAPVRFEDPDTDWLMKFKSELLDVDKEWGPECQGWVVIRTEDYSDR